MEELRVQLRRPKRVDPMVLDVGAAASGAREALREARKAKRERNERARQGAVRARAALDALLRGADRVEERRSTRPPREATRTARRCHGSPLLRRVRSPPRNGGGFTVQSPSPRALTLSPGFHALEGQAVGQRLQRPSAPESSGEAKRYFRATGSLDAACSTDLAIRKGDVLGVLPRDMDESGWWFGHALATGKRGYFPRTFVVPCDEDEGREETDERLREQQEAQRMAEEEQLSRAAVKIQAFVRRASSSKLLQERKEEAAAAAAAAAATMAVSATAKAESCTLCFDEATMAPAATMIQKQYRERTARRHSSAAEVIQLRFREHKEWQQESCAARAIQQRYREHQARRVPEIRRQNSDVAATVIQRRFRARLEWQEETCAARAIQQRYRAHQALKRPGLRREQSDLAATLIQRHYRARAEWQQETNAAKTIQQRFREHRLLKQPEIDCLSSDEAAATIQRRFRQAQVRKRVELTRMNSSVAATVIQRRVRGRHREKEDVRAAQTIQREFRAAAEKKRGRPPMSPERRFDEHRADATITEASTLTARRLSAGSALRDAAQSETPETAHVAQHLAFQLSTNVIGLGLSLFAMVSVHGKRITLGDACRRLDSRNVKGTIHALDALRQLQTGSPGRFSEVFTYHRVIEKLAQFVRDPKSTPKLLTAAAWLLSNLAADNLGARIIQAGAPASLLRLVSHPQSEVAEQALWCLGNLASVSPEALAQLWALPTLARQLLSCLDGSTSRSVEFQQVATWTVCNLAQYAAHAPEHDMLEILRLMCSFFQSNSANDTLITDTCWCFAQVSALRQCFRQVLAESGIPAQLMRLLHNQAVGRRHVKLCVASLRTLGNFVAEEDDEGVRASIQTQRGLATLADLANSRSEPLAKEALWLISNLCSGTPAEIDPVFSNWAILGAIVRRIRESPGPVQDEAMWAVNNAILDASPQQLCNLAVTSHGEQVFEGLLLAAAAAKDLDTAKLCLRLVSQAVDKVASGAPKGVVEKLFLILCRIKSCPSLTACSDEMGALLELLRAGLRQAG